MYYKLDNQEYKVEIIRKNNKNTYIRIKDDLTIYITTNYFTTQNYLKKLLDNNKNELKKMINNKCKQFEKDKNFYYFGKKYDIIIMPNIKNIQILDNKIYVNSEKTLNKWYKKEMIEIFNERVFYYYNKFEEKIPYPKVKLRTMKTRWGVCNKKDNSITLNTKLINYSLEKLDYVVIHELSHFIHFNHSKEFWKLVCKYCPNYKQIRKELKE